VVDAFLPFLSSTITSTGQKSPGLSTSTTCFSVFKPVASLQQLHPSIDLKDQQENQWQLGL